MQTQSAGFAGSKTNIYKERKKLFFFSIFFPCSHILYLFKEMRFVTSSWHLAQGIPGRKSEVFLSVHENTGKLLGETFAIGSTILNLKKEMLCSESLDVFPQFNKHTNNARGGMRGEECQYKTNNYSESLK